MSIVSNNSARGANNTAHTNSPTRHIYTVAEVAAKLNLTEQPNGKYSGAVKGTGTTDNGFVLNLEGNAFTNGGGRYTSNQVAELADISPDQYAPNVEYRAEKSAPASSRLTTAKGAQNPAKKSANAPFD